MSTAVGQAEKDESVQHCATKVVHSSLEQHQRTRCKKSPLLKVACSCGKTVEQGKLLAHMQADMAGHLVALTKDLHDLRAQGCSLVLPHSAAKDSLRVSWTFAFGGNALNSSEFLFDGAKWCVFVLESLQAFLALYLHKLGDGRSRLLECTFNMECHTTGRKRENTLTKVFDGREKWGWSKFIPSVRNGEYTLHVRMQCAEDVAPEAPPKKLRTLFTKK